MTDKQYPPDSVEELAQLVRTLHEAQQRIQTLTQGAVDAVLDPSSENVYLLHHSQLHLRQSESEQRHFAAERASILDALPAHIALLDSEGRIIAVNQAWRRFAAANMLSGDDFGVGGNYVEVSDHACGGSSDEAQAAAAGIRAVLDGDAADFALEYTCHSPGEHRWFRLQVTPLVSGHAGGAVVMHVDVTERKRSEQSLIESEERFRLLSKSTNDAIWEWDLTTDALWWNEGFETMSGFQCDEIDSTIDWWKKQIHPDDADHVDRVAPDNDDNWTAEYRFGCKDGTYLYVLDRGHVIRDAAGKPVRMIGGMTDLTERRRSEERLAEQAALLDVAQDAILVQGMDRRILFWNRSAERLYGWTAAEALGRSIEELLFVSTADFQRAVAATTADGHWTDRIEQHRKDGTKLTVQGKWTLVRDAKGQPLSILAVNTDITDNLALEEQLRQSQRLEAVGQLTGGIAHDFNNLLTVILGNSELLVEQLEQTEELHALAAMIMSAAERGAELTHRLLAFSRRQALEPKVVNVNRLVAGIEGMLRRTLPENISIELVQSGGLWNAMVDPAQLENAILNLGINARDAMKAGGKLTLETMNVRLDHDYAEAHPGVARGQYIMIAISDTGTGIPVSIIGKVFDPFFTTKELGQGTGLGLSMVYGFMKQSGGHVKIYSEVDHGTTVKLYLPRAIGQVESIHEPSRAAVAAGGFETILMVEDDDLVRATVERQLRALGYRVLTAPNGAKALDIFRQDAQIHLLFTDIIMPGDMTGKQLADAARQISPLVRVLFTSGYTEDAFIHQGRLDPGVHLLSKPYHHADLARMTRLALAKDRSALP